MKSDLVILPSLRIPWSISNGFWSLHRNGVWLWVFPDKLQWHIELGPDRKKAIDSAAYQDIDLLVSGLFRCLMRRGLLDVVCP